MSYPVDGSARQRLLSAQRAEADALRQAEAAARTRDRVARRLADAEANVRDAWRELAKTSGSPRAALLLGVEESQLRREIRGTSDSAK